MGGLPHVLHNLFDPGNFPIKLLHGRSEGAFNPRQADESLLDRLSVLGGKPPDLRHLRHELVDHGELACKDAGLCNNCLKVCVHDPLYTRMVAHTRAFRIGVLCSHKIEDMNTKLAALMDELRLVQADLEVEEEPDTSQAILAFARAAAIGTRWKCEYLRKGVTVNTVVAQPYLSGRSHFVYFLPDGTAHKAPNVDQAPDFFVPLFKKPNVEVSQVGKLTFEISDLKGVHTRWARMPGRLGSAQDRLSFIEDLKSNRKWKVQNKRHGGEPFIREVIGAEKTDRAGVHMKYVWGGNSWVRGSIGSMTYDNQAIVKKGSGYQIWWEMTGPGEIWVPQTK